MTNKIVKFLELKRAAEIEVFHSHKQSVPLNKIKHIDVNTLDNLKLDSLSLEISRVFSKTLKFVFHPTNEVASYFYSMISIISSPISLFLFILVALLVFINWNLLLNFLKSLLTFVLAIIRKLIKSIFTFISKNLLFYIFSKSRKKK